MDILGSPKTTIWVRCHKKTISKKPGWSFSSVAEYSHSLNWQKVKTSLKNLKGIVLKRYIENWILFLTSSLHLWFTVIFGVEILCAITRRCRFLLIPPFTSGIAIWTWQ